MKLLLFDIDGTLIDVDRAESEAFSQAFQEVHGFHGINTEWSSYTNYTDTGVVEEIIRSRRHRDPTSEEIEALLDSFVKILKTKLHEFTESNSEVAGARGFLQQLQSSGRYALALATGCIEKSARLKLALFDFNRFFPCGGFSDGAPVREGILRAAGEAASLHYGNQFGPADTVYLGDRLRDAEAALALGMGFIAINQSDEESEKMKSLRVTNIFRDFTDQQQLTRTLEQMLFKG